jgi:hypothetical protein
VQINDIDQGFVFQGATDTVLAIWAPPGSTDNIDFGQPVQILDPLTGGLSNTQTYALTNAPVLVVGVPSSLVNQAQADLNLPYSWGGDYSGATSVSSIMDNPNTEAGLHQLNPDGTSRVVQVGGGPARDCSRSSAQFFTIDPNFLSYTPTPIQITVVARRIGAPTAGFNLKYESTTGWRGAGNAWYTVPGYDRWYTKSWTITDDEFVNKWGYSFRLDSDSTTYSGYYLQSVTVSKLGMAPPPGSSPGPRANPWAATGEMYPVGSSPVLFNRIPDPGAGPGQSPPHEAWIGMGLDVVKVEPARDSWSLPPVAHRSARRPGLSLEPTADSESRATTEVMSDDEPLLR